MKKDMSSTAIDISGIQVKATAVLGGSATTFLSPSLQSSCTREAWRKDSRLSSKCKAWKLTPEKKGKTEEKAGFDRPQTLLEDMSQWENPLPLDNFYVWYSPRTRMLLHKWCQFVEDAWPPKKRERGTVRVRFFVKFTVCCWCEFFIQIIMSDVPAKTIIQMKMPPLKKTVVEIK